MGRNGMGRNCHGPKWLWAEMTSDLHELSFLIFIAFLIFDLAWLHLRSKQLLVHVCGLGLGQVHCEAPACRKYR